MKNGFRLVFLSLALTGCVVIFSCSLTATRPVQDMSDTSAAIRAAKEVQADTLAPELYRQATEWWLKARKEYKFKNFSYAQQFASRARKYAEEAEFEAIKNGGNRGDNAPLDQASAPQAEPAPTPESYPTPEGTPADVYDQRKAADDARQAATEKAQEQEEQGVFSQSGPQTMVSPAPVYNPGGGGLVPVPVASR